MGCCWLVLVVVGCCLVVVWLLFGCCLVGWLVNTINSCRNMLDLSDVGDKFLYKCWGEKVCVFKKEDVGECYII